MNTTEVAVHEIQGDSVPVIHPAGSVDRGAFDQGRDNLHSLVDTKASHVAILRNILDAVKLCLAICDPDL